MDCFRSNGAEITDSRTPGQFTIIKVYDKIDLNISKGTEFKVDVVAGKNIIKNIKTNVSDGILSIDNNNRCNFVRGYKRNITVNVTLPYLVRVENHGVGTTVFSEDFAQDTIHVLAENSGDIYLNGTFNQIKTSSHGNGDIYLNGVCNTLFVYTYGTNLLKGENLTVNTYVFVESISIGDCFINAPTGGKLEYNIWRSGNIYYKGNPAQITNVKGDGSGQLIKQD
ncbi:MAG: DUF2807 domain-containing protein [Bacteroidetes bacterium]|nr:DUF2807 domain-containing protein [Bacteroidota bacterium]